MTHIKTSAICIFLVFALTACGAGSSANNPPSALTSSNSQTTETTDEQFTSAYLTGIYCSCGPTTSTNSSISDDIASLDYVDGILVRISWADLQPSTNSYDWMLLDAQIALAAEYDRHIVLAIMNGPFAPTWLASEGATTFDYPFRGNTETLPLPWDDTYLKYYSAFIQALGQRYANNDRIKLIHVTNATTNGLEMQYVFDSTTINQFTSAGYTEEKLIASWQTILDTYAEAFPNTLLDLDVHPVFNSNTAAQTLTTYGHEMYGKKFGVFSAWWSVHNATNVYPAMFDLLVTASEKSFATVQMVGSTTEGINPLTQQELYDAIQLAADSNIHYVEVWNGDLTDLGMRTQLQSYDQQLEP